MNIQSSTSQFVKIAGAAALLFTILWLPGSVNAQTTETFESVLGSGTTRPTTFTSNSQSFTITSSTCNAGNIFGIFIPSFKWTPCNGGGNKTDVATGSYGVGTSCTGGSCTGTSNKFIDNGGLNVPGAITYSIKTTNAALFTIKSLFIFLSVDGANPSDAGGLTLRGKRSGNTKFTYTKTTGFNTGFAANNGFTYIDLSAGTDFTLYNIDELEIQGGSTMKYIAIDNFRWGAKTAPIALSSASTNVVARGATLNGNVNDNAASTTVSFEYSTSSTLSSGVASIAATPGLVAADAGATTVSANLTGLNTNTTYYYRAKGVNANGTGTGSILSFTTAIALPVDLISFTAIVKNSTVELNWTVANERQLSDYTIERSMNGNDFQTIKTTPANDQRLYRIEDAHPLKGIIFYRLKMQDHDGTTRYSSLVKTEIRSRQSEITIVSNPVENGVVTLLTNSSKLKMFLLTITDMNGRTILIEKLANTENRILFDLNNRLQAGNYVLSVFDSDEVSLKQLITIR